MDRSWTLDARIRPAPRLDLERTASLPSQAIREEARDAEGTRTLKKKSTWVASSSSRRAKCLPEAVARSQASSHRRDGTQEGGQRVGEVKLLTTRWIPFYAVRRESRRSRVEKGEELLRSTPPWPLETLSHDVAS